MSDRNICKIDQMLILYSILTRCLGFLSKCAIPFLPKHRKWWYGRRHQKVHSIEGPRPIWIHCASLGEFEQGRPLIEELKKANPSIPLVLTFFSPSGYEIRSNYQLVDAVYYLPIDLPGKANEFVDCIQPRLAIFVKYEFWFNHLNTLIQRHIPFIFISVLMGPKHFLLRPIFGPLRKIVASANQIFTQNHDTMQLLLQNGFHSVTVAGDTRIDRVTQVTRESKSFKQLESMTKDKRVVIYGSMWPADLTIVAPYIKEHLDEAHLHIIAPHQIGEEMIVRIKDSFDGSIGRLSTMDGKNNLQLVIIDTMGDLAYLYRMAWLAYIGGGFGAGIHSILEPTAFHIPVIFGPRYSHFAEAQELIDIGGGKVIENKKEFRDAVEYFSDPRHYDGAQKGIQSFFHQNEGATSKILHYLRQQNWLV